MSRIYIGCSSTPIFIARLKLPSSAHLPFEMFRQRTVDKDLNDPQKEYYAVKKIDLNQKICAMPLVWIAIL